MKTRRIHASIAGLLQVNSTQLALKIAARDRFIIQSSGFLDITYWVLDQESRRPTVWLNTTFSDLESREK
ncbi:hypothetical protein CXF64_05035 [Pseudoalteromonas sp. GutCa3]|nr:hypothetical protein CXF75_01395 [Pseudoalteromonas arctica]PKG71536.1 hypothetical protein CXF64_05035 [Pseudoalteromonas sp. GutCa3]